MPESSEITGKTTASLELYNKVVRDAHRMLAVAGDEKTISTGAITVTPDSGHGYFTVDTESDAASDDLVTINGGASGDIVALKAEISARVVTLKHGTGNLSLAGSSDVILPSDTVMMLRFDGVDWIELKGPSTLGLQTIYIPAGSMSPATTAPCGDFEQIEITALQPEVRGFPFDPSSNEYAIFEVQMPKKWDKGSIFIKIVWTANSTNTGNVVWYGNTKAFGDGDNLNVAYTQQWVDIIDAHNGVAWDLNISPLSSGKDPGAVIDNEMIHFNIIRVGVAGADTFTADAYLLGVQIYYSIDEENDN